MKQAAGDLEFFIDPTGEVVNLAVLDGQEVLVESETEIAETPETAKVRSRIQELGKEISDAYWELSELVARVNHDKLYRTWGYTRFEDWAKAECDMGRRQAFAFVKIQNYFGADLKQKLLGQPELYDEAVETAKTIGWCKALKLASENVMNAGNAEDVLEKARSLSVDDLETECRSVFKEMRDEEKEDSSETNTMKSVRKAFVLTTYQENVVNVALEKAKATLSAGASDGSALAFICGEYDATGSKSLQETLSNLERQLGITLIAIVEDKDTIAYGGDALERITGTET